MCYIHPTHSYAWKEVKKVMAGSIEKRGKNSYRLSCLAGYDLQGRPIKKTKTVHGSKKDAEIELDRKSVV